jgi:hypothetical protein
LACAYRGEAMPSDEELAGRAGVPVADVAGHVKGLRNRGFVGFPHEIDRRQQALDAEFSDRADWQGRMTQLRVVFRDWTEFRVAREFMAWFIVNGKLPSIRKAAASGKIRRDSVASCRDAVLRKGGEIIGVTVRHG